MTSRVLPIVGDTGQLPLLKLAQLSVVLLGCLVANLIERNPQWLEALPQIHITIAFLARVAPGVLLLVVALALIHHGLTQLLPDKQLDGSPRLQHSLLFGSLATLLGNTKVLIMLLPLLDRLSWRQRLILLTVGFSSTGGITCLSLAALGYYPEQLLLASLMLPLFTAVTMALVLGRDPSPAPISLHIAEQSLGQRVGSYLEGGYKTVANRALIVVSIELLLSHFAMSPEIYQSLFVDIAAWLQLVGFDFFSAQHFAPYWAGKIFVNKDLALGGLAQLGIYPTLTWPQQLALICIMVNLVCVSTVAIIALNIISMIGRRGIPLLLTLPFAVFAAFSVTHLLAWLLLHCCHMATVI